MLFWLLLLLRRIVSCLRLCLRVRSWHLPCCPSTTSARSRMQQQLQQQQQQTA
jgi:hypothetical protein